MDVGSSKVIKAYQEAHVVRQHETGEEEAGSQKRGEDGPSISSAVVGPACMGGGGKRSLVQGVLLQGRAAGNVTWCFFLLQPSLRSPTLFVS